MTSKASFKHLVDDPKSSSSIASSEYETTEHVGKALVVRNKSSFKHPIDDHKSSNSIDSLQSENTLVREHSCDVSKVKPESVGNIPRVGSKYSFKHLNDDHKSSNSIGSLKYEKHVPGVMQLNNRTGSLYAKAKQSFTNTENNDESDEVSRKTSIYRESNDIDVSYENGSSSSINAIYKPHRANDKRWVATQAVRSRKGDLDFKHFRVLRRLRCGDIGSVYQYVLML
ncbi:hypothetical protein GQ457_13G010510 [Hibiscus cannabinus]